MAIKIENWDGVTAPAIPSGWAVSSAALVTATSGGTGVTPTSSPNLLVLPATGAGTRRYATWQTLDGNSGNVTVQANFNIDGQSGGFSFGLFARSNNSSTAEGFGSTFYFLRVGFGSAILGKCVNGTLTNFQTLSATLASQAWYQVTFNLLGTSLTSSVQRLSDGFWLNSSGTFQSSPATLNSVTDSSITGAGYAGLALGAQNDDVSSDDWSLSSFAAAAQIFPSATSSPQRLPRPAYEGYVTRPQIADLNVAGGPEFPDFARGLGRGPVTSYQGMLSRPVFGDRDSSGEQAFPDFARGPQRGPVTSYVGLVSSPQMSDLNVAGSPEFPDQAPGPRRTAASSYLPRSSHHPQIADLLVPGVVVFPDRAPRRRRADATAYQGIGPYAMPQVQTVVVSAATVFPDRADGPRRAARPMYEGMLSDPPYVDAAPPSGRNVFFNKAFWPVRRAAYSQYVGLGPGQQPTPPTPTVPYPAVFPDSARGARRAGGTAYNVITATPVTDASQPAGSPVFPHRIDFSRRADRTAYTVTTSEPIPAGPVSATVHFPVAAKGALRGATTSYIVALRSPPASIQQPSGVISFQVQAPGSRRAANSAYAGAQPAIVQIPLTGVAGSPVFPDRAPAPRRAAADSYRGLISRQHTADARQPAGTIYYAQSAPGARRAGFYTAYVSPQVGDRNQPAQPVYPDQARAARRAAVDAFMGLFSKPIPADAARPAGAIYVATPQRSPARGTADSYRGLISKPLIADARMPAGRIEFPARADAARRTSNSAYIRNNPRVAPERRDVSVSSSFNLSALVNAGVNTGAGGSVFVLAVNATFNLSCNFPLPVIQPRYRHGDVVSFVFTVPSGTILTVPQLTVTNELGVSLGTFPLWTWDFGTTWRYDLLLNERFQPARLRGQTVLLTSTGAYVQDQDFQLVDGGDPASSIIAVYAFEGAAGRFVLAQLRTGRLVQGGEPWI